MVDVKNCSQLLILYFWMCVLLTFLTKLSVISNMSLQKRQMQTCTSTWKIIVDLEMQDKENFERLEKYWVDRHTFDDPIWWCSNKLLTSNLLYHLKLNFSFVCLVISHFNTLFFKGNTPCFKTQQLDLSFHFYVKLPNLLSRHHGIKIRQLKIEGLQYCDFAKETKSISNEEYLNLLRTLIRERKINTY